MAIEDGKCPNCGGMLLLDSLQEKAKCKYCGSELIVARALEQKSIDGIATFDAIMVSGQRALDFDGDFDKALKKYKEALELRPNDYKALWGVYISEIKAIEYAKNYKGYIIMPDDIPENLAIITAKYGKRAYNNAPEEIQRYYSEIMKENNEKLIQPIKSKSRKKGCYIATSIYGSYDCPEVWVLRRYRDFSLDKHFLGRFFIKFYYLISPTLVMLFGKKSWFKKSWKKKLDKKIKKLKKLGYEEAPYNDSY